MNSVFLIAGNTFRETIRNRALYTILFFAIVLILLSVSFGEWSVFARSQVMLEFGLATMSLCGLMLALFIGVGMVGKEISSKTIYSIITRPVGRTHFLLGKFSGLLGTLAVTYVGLAVVFGVVLMVMGVRVNLLVGAAVLLLFVELAVVVAVALFFSTLTSPILAAMLTLAFYVAGHYNDLLEIGMVERSSALFGALLRGIYYLLPNLEHFNLRSPVIYQMQLDPHYVVAGVGYGVLYTALFLIGAVLVFMARDV